MKSGIFLLMIFFVVNCYSQKHWRIEAKELKWIKVHYSEAKFNDVYTWIKTVQDVHDVVKLPDRSISFKLIRHEINTKKHGLSLTYSPTVLFYPVSCNGLIQFKEGKFRVILSNISVYNAFESNVDLENFVLKNKFSEFKSNTTAVRTLNKYNTYFFDHFMYNHFMLRPIDDDW